MYKKTLALVLILGLSLTGCNMSIAPPTPTPTTSPTAKPTSTTAPPTATEIPVTPDTPTPAATPTEAIPTNPADCTNRARFVTDVTISDGSNVPAGSRFTKTWRIQNTGTCTWWSGYTLTHYSQERMGAPDAVPLQLTRPGETTDISVELVASQALGKHEGYFVIKNPAGLIMAIDKDSRLWVIINVVAASATTTATATSTAQAAPGGNTPVAGTPAGGIGYANVTCAYTEDAALAEQVSAQINAYRSQNGLAPYNVNAQLTEAAQAHAADMACNQLFGHKGSNGSTPQMRVAASGYIASSVTENVYGSYPPLTPEQVVMWWKTDPIDPNHNKNLISTKYKEIGVAYAFFNNFGYYVVVFATP